MQINILARRTLGFTTSCALAGTVLFSQPSEAQAAPCGSSTATVAADTWDKFGVYAIAAGCAVGTAVAQMDFSQCYASGKTYSALVSSMVTWWNQMAGNSWAKIGPRALEVDGKILSGTVVLGTERVFCTPGPVDTSDIKIRVTKDGGKAKTDVEICKMAKNGSSTEEFDYTWAKGKDNIGDTESRTVKSAKDKILCVRLNNKSTAKKFSYKISAVRR